MKKITALTTINYSCFISIQRFKSLPHTVPGKTETNLPETDGKWTFKEKNKINQPNSQFHNIKSNYSYAAKFKDSNCNTFYQRIGRKPLIKKSSVNTLTRARKKVDIQL